jgi:hypothetical protein
MAGSSSSSENVQAAINAAASPDSALEAAQSLGDLAGSGGIQSINNVTASTKINSLEELKALNPQLFNMILQGIAQNMLIDFRRREDRLEEEMKKNRDDSY